MSKRTPILIKFVTPVILEDDALEPQVINPVKLVIVAPQSSLHSVEQTLALTTVVTVPFDQELRLRLLPSDSYKPKGRYKVKVLQGKNSTPLYDMTWIVPEPPEVRTISVVNQGNVDDINVAAFEVLDVSHNGEYKLEGSKLIWTQNPPPLNVTYQVTYQPAVTLDRLIVTDDL